MVPPLLLLLILALIPSSFPSFAFANPSHHPLIQCPHSLVGLGLIQVEGAIRDEVCSCLVSLCLQPLDVPVMWQGASCMCLCGVALFEVRGSGCEGVGRTWGDSGGSCVCATTVTRIL